MSNNESTKGEIVMYQPDETIRLEVRMGELYGCHSNRWQICSIKTELLSAVTYKTSTKRKNWKGISHVQNLHIWVTPGYKNTK